jgi:alkylation response protein AidB-like acyl-CoA dehydrogenase
VTTLDFERSSIGSAVGTGKNVETLIRYAQDHAEDEVSLLRHRVGLRHDLADRYLEAQIARLMSYRIVTMQASGLIPNHEASMGKLYPMELNQRIASTAMHVFGLSRTAVARGRSGRSGTGRSTTIICGPWRTRSRVGRARFSATSSRGGGCRGRMGVQTVAPTCGMAWKPSGMARMVAGC